MNLLEKLSAAEAAIDSIETTDDYIVLGLEPNHSKTSEIKGIIGLLRGDEEACIVCEKTKNFFDRFGIETEESNNRCYYVRPRHKGTQPYKNEPWYADLYFLLENGYCTPKKEFLYPIFEACGELS